MWTRFATFFGIARLARLLRLLVPLCLAVFAGAFWAGTNWEQGQQAQRELDEQADMDLEAADESTRQKQISAQFETNRQIAREVDRQAAESFRLYLLDRPGLIDCGLDADGLQLWQSWSDSPVARARAEPVDQVPSDAAETRKRGSADPG